MLLLLLLFSSSLLAALNPFALPVGAIIIDAGHGGHDSGARSSDTPPLLEKEVVLDVAQRVYHLLQQSVPEVKTYLTRNSDIYLTLDERAAMARTYEVDAGKQTLFISIHANGATTSEASGFEVVIKEKNRAVNFYHPDTLSQYLTRFASYRPVDLNALLNEANCTLAETLVAHLAYRFPEMRNRGVKEQDVWVLHASTVTSALIEIGFMTNSEEAQRLANQNWRQEMATAIVAGLLSYIQSTL